MISKCTCVHEFQDARYGKFNRVFNVCTNSKIRCSVCLKQDVSSEKTKEKK